MTHSITAIDHRTTPEGATEYQWICSCERRGKWTTLAMTESAGQKHARRPQAMGMSRERARAQCDVRWGSLGMPFTRAKRRGEPNRFEIGYLEYNGTVHVMGAGKTWEEAFERAQESGE